MLPIALCREEVWEMTTAHDDDRITITFLPNDITITIEAAEAPTILEIAREAGVGIYAPCGGQGRCTRCIVAVDGSYELLSPLPAQHRNDEELVLACQCRPTGDLTVTIPEGTKETIASILSDSREAEFEIDPPMRKVYLELPPPTLSDNLCDLMRISRAMGLGQQGLQVSLSLLRALDTILRDHDWKVTATVCTVAQPPRLVDLAPGDTTDHAYGLALDIGTTTVVGKLVSLNDGAEVARAAAENGQIPYGEDVIARINYATDEERGLATLRNAILHTVSGIVSDLVSEIAISPGEIVAASIAGNTTMEHLFLGIPSNTIRLEPYIGRFCNLDELRADDIGLPINPAGGVYFLPARAGFVGGDITADILASGMHRRDEISLLIDVGTNGEVVLGNNEWLMACSCSAGPAFEGGEVAHGMRAGDGAIERVELNDDGEVLYQTIGDIAPRGICGSGLIDCIAELYAHGLIDRAGSLQREASDAIVSLDALGADDYGLAFVLVAGEETATGEPIYILQSDIKNILRTKAAMYAACSLLVKTAGLTFDNVARVYISGGFGHHLDSWKSRILGLLPDLEVWRYEYIGNGALEGARMALLSCAARKDALAIFNNMTYIELSVKKEFMDEFSSAQFIPHTDISCFPSVEHALTEERLRKGVKG